MNTLYGGIIAFVVILLLVVSVMLLFAVTRIVSIVEKLSKKINKT